ncbi:hypothetical protein L6R29_14855 [Myxococcota bacterium]|nr:hypothetical protein [Myxococcota bacterium]
MPPKNTHPKTSTAFRNLRLFLLCSAMAFLLQACPPGFRYYVPTDTQDRKSQQIDLNVGRVFSFRRTACVAFRLTNWSNAAVSIPRSVMLLQVGSDKRSPMTLEQAAQTAAFQRSIRDYYGKSGGRSAEEMAKVLYAPDAIPLDPKVAQTRMLCYSLQDLEEPASFIIQGLEVNSKPVDMKPFLFRELKQPS